MNPFMVVVYGPVGVGKSSVVERLAERRTLGRNDDARKLIVVREPTDAMIECGALEDVYANRPSSGYRLQMLVMAERMSTYWQASSLLSRCGVRKAVVVADGHLALDQHIFVDEHMDCGRMSRKELGLYSSSVGFMLANCPVFVQRPDMYVYLHASPEACAHRAASRGRTEESSLNLGFFTSMVDACDRVTKRLAMDNSTALVVVHTDDETLDAVCESVTSAIACQLLATTK